MERGEKNPKGGRISMILPKREDALHKAQLFRLLTEILDSPISQSLYFKGGTAAAMAGSLDRFSLDLDFDLKRGVNKIIIDKNLKLIFKNLGYELKSQSKKTLFYVVKYEAAKNLRNTIKLSIFENQPKTNLYEPLYLKEIDRLCLIQTEGTMFANKLVALTDRYKKHRVIAGRDLYDIHYFFLQGYRYSEVIIKERTGKLPQKYFQELISFIEKKISEKIISQDLSFLLPYKKFISIRKVIKKETVMFLKDEIKRLLV